MPVYILHIEPAYQHARHYIGFTTRPVADRVAEHLAGRGSPLVAAALAAGCEVTVARKWHCGTREFERFLKNRKETGKFCPCCSERPRRVSFAAYRRFKDGGGFVRPSRKYYALAAFAGTSVADVLLMSADERRALDARMKNGPGISAEAA